MLTKPLPGVGYILLEEGEPSNSYKQVYGLLAALDIHFHLLLEALLSFYPPVHSSLE